MSGRDLATLDTNRALAYVQGDGYSYADAVQRAGEAWHGVRQNALAFGLHLLAIRQHEPHGQYMAALERIGVPDRSARKFCSRVKFLLENNDRPALADLTGEQLDQLIRVPPQLRAKALDTAAGTIAGRPIEEAARLSTHEFRRLVRRAVDDTPDAPRVAPDPVTAVLGHIQALDEGQRNELCRRLAILPLLKKTAWAVTRREA